MPSASPLPQPSQPDPDFIPLEQPKRTRTVAPPSFGLTAGLCVLASAVTAMAIVFLTQGGQDPVASGLATSERWGSVVAGELVKVVRVGGTVETMDFASVRVPRLRGPRDVGKADLTLTMLADAGAIVKVGDPIAEFELRWLVDHIRDRESVVVRTESQYRKREADIAVLKETERQARLNAKAEYQKAVLDVRTAEVRSDIEAEVLKNVAAEAKVTWDQLEEEGQLKETVHSSNLRDQGFNVKKEVLHLERHLRDLERLEVKAPINGMVVRETLFLNRQFAQAKEGDRIYPGALFLRIVDVSQMIVNAAVNQTDVQSVRIGDEAFIEIDAYPGERFRGRVLDIGAVATSAPAGSPFSRGSVGNFIKHIPLRVLIEDKDERILPDLSASVDVLSSQRPSGVLVPREAVRSDSTNDYLHAYVRTVDGYERRVVSVADTSDTQALIMSGLAIGEEVLLSELPATSDRLQ